MLGNQTGVQKGKSVKNSWLIYSQTLQLLQFHGNKYTQLCIQNLHTESNATQADDNYQIINLSVTAIIRGNASSLRQSAWVGPIVPSQESPEARLAKIFLKFKTDICILAERRQGWSATQSSRFYHNSAIRVGFGGHMVGCYDEVSVEIL